MDHYLANAVKRAIRREEFKPLQLSFVESMAHNGNVGVILSDRFGLKYAFVIPTETNILAIPNIIWRVMREGIARPQSLPN